MHAQYQRDLNALQSHRPELARQLSELGSLEGVFEWLRKDLQNLEMVPQDEFHHDLFLPLNPKGEYLVLGATWLGALTAVAVWSHRPTPDELLTWRLQRGWKPTRSNLVGGPRILGYAARLEDELPEIPSSAA